MRKELYKELDRYLKEGKILIASPHQEAIDYLVENNIKFCFIHPKKTMKKEIARRMEIRGNSSEIIKENEDLFEEF